MTMPSKSLQMPKPNVKQEQAFKETHRYVGYGGARGGKEKWVEQKEQHQSKTVAKTLDALSNKEVDRAARLMTVADKLLKKVEVLVDQEGPITANAIKNLSDALKNIRETQMIKSDQDIREQEARIAKLQKEAEKQDNDKSSITITLEGGLSDYAQ